MKCVGILFAGVHNLYSVINRSVNIVDLFFLDSIPSVSIRSVSVDVLLYLFPGEDWYRWGAERFPQKSAKRSVLAHLFVLTILLDIYKARWLAAQVYGQHSGQNGGGYYKKNRNIQFCLWCCCVRVRYRVCIVTSNSGLFLEKAYIFSSTVTKRFSKMAKNKSCVLDGSRWCTWEDSLICSVSKIK